MDTPNELKAAGVTLDDAMRRLHVMTDAGVIVKNAEAFFALWSKLPYFRHFSTLCVSIPGAVPLANFIYELFAERRFVYRSSLPMNSPCKIRPKGSECSVPSGDKHLFGQGMHGSC